MTSLSFEAVVALFALLVAIPPAIFAYLQWNNAHQLRLPYHATGGSPQYQLNVFINAPYATGGFSRRYQRTSSGGILEATGDNPPQ
ncbi:hypothetical protein CGCSCA1_v003249 [Colletotrichum siamense]|nr:hypothetical protein CGCSCA1_v003249 [Colletotrichum siamense]